MAPSDRAYLLLTLAFTLTAGFESSTMYVGRRGGNKLKLLRFVKLTHTNKASQPFPVRDKTCKSTTATTSNVPVARAVVNKFIPTMIASAKEEKTCR
jgi:hypothetical protein